LAGLKRVGEAQGVTRLYDKPEDLFADTDIDIVDVCVTNMFPAPLTVAELQAAAEHGLAELKHIEARAVGHARQHRFCVDHCAARQLQFLQLLVSRQQVAFGETREKNLYGQGRS